MKRVSPTTLEKPIVKKKPKKEAAKGFLRVEILEAYNTTSLEQVEYFEDIQNPYTVMEAYLASETGKKEGLKNKIFMAVFDDVIADQHFQWVGRGNEGDWDIDRITCIEDFHRAIALMYINRHCIKKDGSVVVDRLHFRELRELTKHLVIDIFRTWGVEGYEELYTMVHFPKFMQAVKEDSEFMQVMGVTSVAFNMGIN